MEMLTGDALFHFQDFFPEDRIKGLELVKTSKWNGHFHSEIPFGNSFGLPFMKFRFPRKFAFGDDQQSFVSRSNFHILKKIFLNG